MISDLLIVILIHRKRSPCAYWLGNISNPLTISEKLATHRWC